MLINDTNKKSKSSSRSHHLAFSPMRAQSLRVKQILHKTSIQAKLAISTPDDKYEQEADRVAQRVMQMPESVEPVIFNKNYPVKELIQPKSMGKMPLKMTSEVSADIHSLQGGGQPLSNSERRFFEPRFGVNFSSVRLHSNASANNTAQSVNARAFTLGLNIVFASDQYVKDTSSGRKLLAHELTHVIQQNRLNQLLQGEHQPVVQSIIQREADTVPDTASTGTLEDVVFLVSNPLLESDEGLRTAINLLDRYDAHVTVDALEFRLLPSSSQDINLGASFDTINGRAHWEGDTPVVELPQSLLNIAGEHMNRTGDPTSADIAEVHSLIQTIGHEMYHLWRDKEGHSDNLIQPVYEAEAARRMEQVRQNWLAEIIEPGGKFGNPTRTSLGINQSAVISTWDDIDEGIRTRIEEGATSTDYITGLYLRSAYLVEEIYTKIEELSFLRIQQRFEPDEQRTTSRQHVSSLASMVFRLSNILNNGVYSGGIITETLLADARVAMPEYLRTRYPNRSESSRDSYEVIFYFTAIRGGLPPIYNSRGQVVSTLPPEARPPVGRP